VISTFAQTPNPPALTPKQVAQRTLPSIVILIINNGDSLPVTTGSGFFVAEDTIITNYHVVKNARLGAFKIYGSDEVYSVIGTIGVDSVNDLALLKVKGVKGKPLKLNVASLNIQIRKTFD
jgi:S1-C subfamily serine protease